MVYALAQGPAIGMSLTALSSIQRAKSLSYRDIWGGAWAMVIDPGRTIYRQGSPKLQRLGKCEPPARGGGDWPQASGAVPAPRTLAEPQREPRPRA